MLKKFYKKNKCISRIGIISLMISLSYVATYDMPDYLGIEPLYSFLNNVSISYIAALIFFVVQVYKPEEDNKKKSMQILNNQFIRLVELIDSTILLCERYIKIDEKGATICWNDSSEMLFVKYSKNEEMKSSRLACYTKKELSNLINIFNKLLKEIKELPVVNYCDYEVLEKLSEIERNRFFEELDTVAKYADTDLNLNGLKIEMDKMKVLASEFKELCFITSYSLFIADMSDKEKKITAKAIVDVSNDRLSIESINKILKDN